MDDIAIKKRIEEKMPGARVEIRDLTGTRDHWQVIVVSPRFEGLPMLKQHRLVKAFFEQEIAVGSVHAFSLKTYTPREWSKLNP
ncbi:MAG: BolA family transcriptional regulator [Deltaproteobacteria bacterium]|nr:BolA family transcriptional regulator [Deltaproteobacteria bacterium]